ncbi:MAG: glycosyltransferase family 2 protein [Planctomycetota bacterium]|jgi:alpha-1,3-rhamnosyltransferase|nr:glycosyltransferase family 2 protein [Planctomycetota bacterium]
MTAEEATPPLCSVCSLCYNHSRFLDAHFASVWSQTYPNIEVLALDDGSPDGSAAMLEGMAGKSPRPMTVITQGNSGRVGANFQAMLGRASGKYVVFISCDDALPPTAIADKIALLEKDGDLAFVASRRYLTIAENGDMLGEEEQSFLDDSIRTADDLLELEYSRLSNFYIQNAVFRKSVVDAAGGFDDDLLNDDFVLRTKLFLHMRRRQDLKFRIDDRAGLYYRLHGGNISKQNIRWLRMAVEVLDRYFPDRPTPPELASIARIMVKRASLGEMYAILTLSPRIHAMLDDREFAKALYYCTLRARGKRPLSEYIYRREKMNGVRKVTLFSCLRLPGSTGRPLYQYLFRREKNGVRRTLILFSLFRIGYVKK